MPKGLNEDGEARWLLCRASDWPDQVRTAKPNKAFYPPLPAQQCSYNRSPWHFIDTPLLILADGTSDDEAKALAYARALKQIEPLLADADLNVQGKRGRRGKRPQAMGPRELRVGEGGGL